MRQEELLQRLSNLQYSDEDVAEYDVEIKVDKQKIKRAKMVVTKSILMQRCYQEVQDDLQEREEILYSMFATNPRVKGSQTGTAAVSGVGVLAMHFGINSVLIVTNKKLYVFFVDRYYNDVDLKVYQLDEVVSMKTVLDRKDGSEFLYIKFTNGKEYVLLGIDEEYRELFQVLRKEKKADDILLSLQDKKLTWALRGKRMGLYIFMYSFVIYFFYKAYVNFMPH
ncbi:septation ring formation regulator EzrA [Bacillus cereus]|uniref:septation ring formation regulator EzrA n=1 Tax=Bacillus cereus TaxID=1396 RepID=UPI000BF80FCD|nr:septation ring formation regulator EzrA [Bacillus cereus]PFR27952.1 septation ring formation regulator EzrA [Bacillus cereus]